MKTRLKRYIIAVIISAAIAVIIALPASAANIYFTSVNNILMPLRDDTMPISYNGAMYIPYSVFNSTELGTYAIYSSSAQAVTVFGDGAQLIYSLRSGTTYDNIGVKYNYRAVYMNGRIYIPIAFTCRYFEINYSTIYGNEYGTIIRMTVGDALDDDTFSAAASTLMKSRLNDYLSSLETPSPSPSAAPTATPAVTTSPASSPRPSDDGSQSSPAPDFSDVDVYLSFFGIDAEYTPRILDSLAQRSYTACFFLTAEDISAYPDIVRRISASGHSTGIVCSESISADYNNAMRLLFDAAQTSAFIAASSYSGSRDEQAQSFSDAGLAYYCNASDASSLSLSSCRSRLDKAGRRIDFIFSCNGSTAERLSSLLRLLQDGKYNVSRLNEINAGGKAGG